jgi:putative peptidoglycan lipid II flippase
MAKPEPHRGRLARVRERLAPLLPRAALLLATLTFGEAVAGLLRNRALAQAFGAGPALDAYNAAAAVPELLLDVVVGGAIQAALVPVFTGLRHQDEAEATVFGRTVIVVAVLAMVPVAIALFLGAPALASIAVPGFDAAGREQYTTVIRIIAITPVIFAAAIAIGELLVAHRRFLGYGLAPIFYNGGIIAGTLLLAGRLGIAGPAVGAVVGALMYLGVRLWDLRGTGFTIRPALAIRTKAFRDFIVLAIPKLVGQPIEPLTRLLAIGIASTLASGSVTAVVFAWNFESGAVSIIGVAFAVVAFPRLTAAAVDRDRPHFTMVLRQTGLAITGLSIIAAVALATLGGVVIANALGGGAFDTAAITRTALALGAFAVAIPIESLAQLLARAIYATRNTLLPVGAAVVGFAVMAATAVILVGQFGLVGIPLAYALGYGVRAVLLGLILVRRVGRMETPTPAAGLAPGTD